MTDQPRRRALGAPIPPQTLIRPDADAQDIHPIPGGQEVGKRRRRRRRPLYRRPLVVIPAALLLVALSTAAVVGYRVESLMTSVQAVSTPPPMVTDATYMEEDDPDMPSGPITVDTGPARAVLESADTSPRDGEGFGARLQQAVSNSSDLVGGAAVATGLKNAGGNPMTLLVMGVDAQPGAAIDIGVRPDVLMLVRLDPQTRSCRVLAIPRDTRVDLPGYGESKINHALMVGGIPYQLLVTEAFLDIEIDHYLLIDFVAFRELVDSVGGVTVNVPEDLVKDGEVRFQAGAQHLNGEQALAYTRFRSTPDGDIGRVERRWALLAGLANALQGRDLVGDANRMLPALQDHFRTDLSATDITQIARDYGAGCTSPGARSEGDIEMLEGTRVRLSDPIVGQSLYFNVVDESAIDRYVAAFLTPGAPGTTPAASPEATPATTPGATPGVTRTERERWAATQRPRLR